MRILVCDKMDDKAIEELKKIEGAEVTVKVGMDVETLNATIPDYHIAIVRSATKIRKETIDVAKNLKAIIRGGVGIDNIDSAYAKEKGIAVRNTPKASSISVAELSLSMMFALSRHIPKADKSMKEGRWDKKLFKGCELYEKTLCIIGCGNIGIELGNRALALGMKVLYTDIIFKDYGNIVEKVTKVVCKVSNIHPELNIVNFNSAIEKADIISIHVPFIKEYGPVIKEEEFKRMKDGVMIINAARGGVIKESALIEALKSGKVKAAGIDVYEEEPTKNTELINMENVICTPHIGAATKEGQARVGMEVVNIAKEYA